MTYEIKKKSLCCNFIITCKWQSAKRQVCGSSNIFSSGQENHQQGVCICVALLEYESNFLKPCGLILLFSSRTNILDHNLQWLIVMDTLKNGWASSSDDCWTRLQYHQQQYLHLSKKRLNANGVSVHLSAWLLCMVPIKLKREGKYIKGIKWRERRRKRHAHVESNYNIPYSRMYLF